MRIVADVEVLGSFFYASVDGMPGSGIVIFCTWKRVAAWVIYVDV